MKIVIDIPDELYTEYVSVQLSRGNGKSIVYNLLKAIKNGTPLPKGHGRLGDLDKLEREMYHEAFETDTDLQKWDSGCWIRYKMFENAIDNIPTIIESDGGEYANL